MVSGHQMEVVHGRPCLFIEALDSRITDYMIERRVARLGYQSQVRHTSSNNHNNCFILIMYDYHHATRVLEKFARREDYRVEWCTGDLPE